MSTGYDNLYDALSNYGRDEEIVERFEGNIGDAQELCEDAADLIFSMRNTIESMAEVLDRCHGFVDGGPSPGLTKDISEVLDIYWNEERRKALYKAEKNGLTGHDLNALKR